MQIAFIGFGEAARTFCATLRAAGHEIAIAAYDIQDTQEMREAMQAHDVRHAITSTEAISGADVVFSAVTADESLNAARQASSGLRAGQFFVDINSVSPGRKQDSAAAVAGTGASYIDLALMSPVQPRGHASPVLIAGPDAARLRPALDELGFSYEIVGEEVGAATAIKMVRSVFMKGLEAIVVEMGLAAVASGCFDRVVHSLADTYPQFDWSKMIAYHFERSIQHGTRRGAEMQESAATLDALGLNGELARQIAAVEASMGSVERPFAQDRPLQDAIAEVLKRRLAAKTPA